MDKKYVNNKYPMQHVEIFPEKFFNTQFYPTNKLVCNILEMFCKVFYTLLVHLFSFYNEFVGLVILLNNKKF